MNMFPNQNNGFSKILTLVSLSIITLGLLCCFTWQIYSTSQEQDKLNHKIASLLANDIANRMQINYQETRKGKSSFYVHATNLSQQHLVDQHIDYYCEQESQGCEPYTIAANDIAIWRKAIKENLNNGLGEIHVVRDNLNSYAINIRWQDLFNNKKRSLITNIFLPNQPWQYICDLSTDNLPSTQKYNNLQKTQMIYDIIMGNKHNYKKFDFTAEIFNDYVEKINNINLSLADQLCATSCSSTKNAAVNANLCDCNKNPQKSISFSCKDYENNE